MSVHINRVFVAGELARDPEKPSEKGPVKLNLKVVDTYEKDGETKTTACYIAVTCWGRTGELAQAHLKEGSEVFVDGAIKTESWEKDGKKQYRTVVNAFKLQFLGKAPEKAAESEESYPF